jgi:hypothetical protein
MIVKIYRERGTNKKSRGERKRGLTLTRIILHHHKNYTSSKKGKRWQEQDKTGRHHCSALAGNALYKGV